MADIIDDLPPLSAIPNEPTDPAPVDARSDNIRLLNPERPHYDLPAERALLGAALYRAEAADVVAKCDPGIFYVPAHQEIATAISVLRAHDESVDAVTVAAEVRRRNPTTSIQNADLISLTADVPLSKHTDTYLHQVQESARLRKLQTLGHVIKDAATKGDADSAIEAAESIREVAASTEKSTWNVVDLGEVLDNVEPPRPSILHRNDGHALIYPGRVHAFNGASESGKSWLAFAACAEEIKAGHNVVFYDFEDSAANAVSRLKALSVTDDELLRHFYYARPDDNLNSAAKATIQETITSLGPSLCVVDGVTEAMVMNGWSINDNDDVQQFLESLPRPIAAVGIAVIMIDHVVKNRETEGDHAIGAQHKKAGIDVSYNVRVTQRFAPGQSGRLLLTVWKDRPGSVRAFSAHQKIAGEVALNSEGDHVQILIQAPSDDGKPTFLMERSSRVLELNGPLSKSDWEKEVKGSAPGRRRAMELLVAEGYVEIRKEGHQQLHHSVRTYRQIVPEPESEEF